MSIEEEKKLVLEWRGCLINPNPMMNIEHYNYKDGILIGLHEYNPQDNDLATCKQWDDIYEILEDVEDIERGLFLEYMDNLRSILLLTYDEDDIDWEIHRAKPSIRWEALIKAIMEVKNET